VLDYPKGEIRREGLEFAEAIAEFPDTLGMPGRASYTPSWSSSTKADWFALRVVKDSPTPLGGYDVQAGTVLIRIPAW